MSTAVINGLLAELAERGITLAVDGGQLVARGRAGAMTAELAERVKRHKAALVEALTSGPAEAQPVEANAPAAAAPVAAPAVGAPAVELPPGWPADVPPPPWWGEFTASLDTIWLLAARRQQCGDPACRFPVAVQWAGVEYPAQWACPRCGRTADQEG
jgi:hypothetical protein